MASEVHMPWLALASPSTSEQNKNPLTTFHCLFQFISFSFGSVFRSTQVSTSQTSIFVSVAKQKSQNRQHHTTFNKYFLLYVLWNAQHSKHTNYLFSLILFKGMREKKTTKHEKKTGKLTHTHTCMQKKKSIEMFIQIVGVRTQAHGQATEPNENGIEYGTL